MCKKLLTYANYNSVYRIVTYTNTESSRRDHHSLVGPKYYFITSWSTNEQNTEILISATWIHFMLIRREKNILSPGIFSTTVFGALFVFKNKLKPPTA